MINDLLMVVSVKHIQPADFSYCFSSLIGTCEEQVFRTKLVRSYVERFCGEFWTITTFNQWILYWMS
jgi:hypothetical protein